MYIRYGITTMDGNRKCWIWSWLDGNVFAMRNHLMHTHIQESISGSKVTIQFRFAITSLLFLGSGPLTRKRAKSSKKMSSGSSFTLNLKIEVDWSRTSVRWGKPVQLNKIHIVEVNHFIRRLLMQFKSLLRSCFRGGFIRRLCVCKSERKFGY